jgi:putative phage-type endonuclease
MQHHTLTQGSPEWHAHRATCFNASDAPAMLGVSSYRTRSELLRELATGLKADVSAAQQKRFDDGHRFEALARQLGEAFIGEELFPVTGSEAIEGLSRRLSASFDGLTMLEDTAWEHKTLNDRLRAAMPERGIGSGADLPLEYRAQMEQQLLVSGANRVLFTASKWTRDGELIECRHAWYESDTALRAQLLAGWAQLEKDLAAWQPTEAAPAKPIGRTIDNLPAVVITAKGEIQTSNLAEFKAHALEVIRGINRELKTDQDFADAEAAVKFCGEVEARMAQAKDAVLAQTVSIAEALATLDEVADAARKVRLALDKDVKAKKDELRAALIMRAKLDLGQHVADVNAGIERPAGVSGELVPVPAADFAAVIKGKRTLASCEDAISIELARAKGVANTTAQLVATNIAYFAPTAQGLSALFTDLKGLLLKDADTFKALVDGRIAQHQAEQQAREAEQQRRQAVADAENAAMRARLDAMPIARPVAAPAQATAPKADEAPTLKLGTINERLGFNVSADFLEGLGIHALKAGNSRLYRQSDWPRICDALMAHLADVREPLAVAA